MSIKLSSSLFKNGIANNPEFFMNEIDKSPTSLFTAGILFLSIEKNSYQEIGLTNFSFNKEKQSSSEINQNTLGLRYEYGKLGRQFNNHFSFRYGAFLEFFYGNNDLTPTTTQGFPVEQKSTGVNLAFSPHLDIALSKRFFIDLNPSLVLISYYFEKIQTLDPTLPKRQQEQSSFNIDTGGLNVMVGVGYRL